MRYEKEPGHPGPDDLRGHIGSTLRRRRELHRLTQAQLSERAGVSQATVARIERGDRAPSVELLERLFVTLGCQVRLRLEPLGRRVDETIAALAGVPIGRLDPRSPGEHRWRIIGGAVIQAELSDDLPAAIEVRHDGQGYRVVSLPEVEIDAATPAALLLRRHRQLRAA